MLVKSKVKYIQSLSDKKQRDTEGVFVAEGPKVVEELLLSPTTPLVELFATAEWMGKNAGMLTDTVQQSTHEVAPSELQRISSLSTPHQVVGIFKKPVWKRQASPLKDWVLMLDGIQDPGNMGTIIRCADWFGIPLIITGEGAADPYGPKTVQSSMGSVARVQVWQTNLEAYLHEWKMASIYAAVLEGQPVEKLGKKANGILLIGNESKGISPPLLRSASIQKITIPRKGQAESLNAAVATGILLSHLI
jgi:TrmH family RNA methyltransferase